MGPLDGWVDALRGLIFDHPHAGRVLLLIALVVGGGLLAAQVGLFVYEVTDRARRRRGRSRLFRTPDVVSVLLAIPVAWSVALRRRRAPAEPVAAVVENAPPTWVLVDPPPRYYSRPRVVEYPAVTVPDRRTIVEERTRHWLYLVGFVAILGLIGFDVLRGGDAASWVTWIAGAIGLGTAGLAAKNTNP